MENVLPPHLVTPKRSRFPEEGGTVTLFPGSASSAGQHVISPHPVPLTATPSWAHSPQSVVTPGTPAGASHARVPWHPAQSSSTAALLHLTPEPATPPQAQTQARLQQPHEPHAHASTPNQQQPGPDQSKRGRPRADLINHLMWEGSSSPSEIKCKVCHRVFPREKSLQAHLRTHTGERPYACDYPGCSKAFTQSGQLKTHQRLHAGEKPFACSAPG